MGIFSKRQLKASFVSFENFERIKKSTHKAHRAHKGIIIKSIVTLKKFEMKKMGRLFNE